MPDHDPAVSPEQEARLRRLLAQARHGEPVPVDVAARLDRVLEQLAAEEADPAAGDEVVDLATRRRRRVRTLLVAAAAVAVIGVGVGQLVDGPEQQATSSDAAAASQAAGSGSEDSAAAPAPEAAQLSTLDDAPAADQATAPRTQSYSSASRPRPPVVLSDGGFARQAVRLRDRPGLTAPPGAVVPGSALSRAETFVCETAPWGEGRLLAALYDGVPAVLAYRPVAGETQTVDLLRCGTGEVLRSTVLPVEG